MAKTNHEPAATPEQAKYDAAADAVAAERIAKNKAHAAADAYESVQPVEGAYGNLTKRAAVIQSLSTAGRSWPAPTVDEVTAAEAEAAAATANADKAIASM